MKKATILRPKARKKKRFMLRHTRFRAGALHLHQRKIRKRFTQAERGMISTPNLSTHLHSLTMLACTPKKSYLSRNKKLRHASKEIEFKIAKHHLSKAL